MKGQGTKAAPALNLLLYQLGWFACVLGAAGGWPHLGAALALVLVAVHCVLAARPAAEWPLLLAALGLGAIVDSLHVVLGVLDFAGDGVGSPARFGMAPLWVLVLWLQFGTLLHFSLRWLSGRYILAAVLGLVGGPLAFLGGERLGAATFGEPLTASLTVVGISWALALPLLVRVADRQRSEGRYRWPWKRTTTRELAGSEAGTEMNVGR